MEHRSRRLRHSQGHNDTDHSRGLFLTSQVASFFLQFRVDEQIAYAPSLLKPFKQSCLCVSRPFPRFSDQFLLRIGDWQREHRRCFGCGLSVALPCISSGLVSNSDGLYAGSREEVMGESQCREVFNFHVWSSLRVIPNYSTEAVFDDRLLAGIFAGTQTRAWALCRQEGGRASRSHLREKEK